MKAIATWGALLLVASFASLGASVPQQPDMESSVIRVGVFDSRAVAIAYSSSDFNKEYLSGLRAEYELCRSRCDEYRIQEIEQRARARDARLHKQSFSTAPVDDILALIEDDLRVIAEHAGVGLIVSKWRVAYQGPDVEPVDITELIVDPFNPGENALRKIRELPFHDPLPLYGTNWRAIDSN